MTRTPKRLAVVLLTAGLVLGSAAGCDALGAKKAGDSQGGGGPQGVGQNTGNKLNVP